eukprot:10652338-Alexandrium_andersonii.AAC.1
MAIAVPAEPGAAAQDTAEAAPAERQDRATALAACLDLLRGAAQRDKQAEGFLEDRLKKQLGKAFRKNPRAGLVRA